MCVVGSSLATTDGGTGEPFGARAIPGGNRRLLRRVPQHPGSQWADATGEGAGRRACDALERFAHGRLEYPSWRLRAVAPNITPDLETGIGRWTDAQIATAIREGRRPDGSIIGPPMPIALYRGLSDRDLTAMVVYLRTVPRCETRSRNARRIRLRWSRTDRLSDTCRTLPMILLPVVPTSRDHWRIAWIATRHR